MRYDGGSDGSDRSDESGGSDTREVEEREVERGEVEVREVEVREIDVREGDVPEDEQLRALLEEAAPEFAVTPALGDRALAGAARRRVRTRVIGGAGAVAVLAVGALAIVPLAGWGGHESRAAATAGEPRTAGVPAWATSPKMKALDRVVKTLQDGHDFSFMGAGLSGQNYFSDTNDTMMASATDASPIVVYRKPAADPTLERDAIRAAAPYSVVFRDTVLNASEQWELGHRIEQDQNYWKSHGVRFLTSLQENGTITIFSPDPGTTLPLLEQHYGYDGRVFVGKQMNFNASPLPGSKGAPPVTSPTGK